jgi:hypothetical protein
MSRITMVAMLLACTGVLKGQAAPEKTGGEVMKNVRVLQDVPASEWDDTMGFMANALGVDCRYCHGAGGYEKDDLKPKQTARAMIEMSRELNRRAFGGRSEVTCYTCHQGGAHPTSVPTLWNKTPEQLSAAKKEAAPPRAASQSVEQVYARYREAVGGEFRSARMKATIHPAIRAPFDIEIEMLQPGRMAIQAAVGGSQFRQIFDGAHGFTVTKDGSVPMTPAMIGNLKKTLEAMTAVKFTVPAAPRKTAGMEEIGGREYAVLESQSAKMLERLYFDAQSGLLYRRYLETRTPLGTSPNEITYEDYRDVNGVKLPYLVTIRGASERAQYRFSEIETNIDLAPARFELPQK